MPEKTAPENTVPTTTTARIWVAVLTVVAMLFGAGVAADAAFAAPTTPTLAVSKTTALAAGGETITITGTNYVSAGSPGVYAQIGYLDASWRPSESAAAATRSSAYTAWVQGTNPTAGPYVQWADNGDGTADFTWTVTVTKAALDAKARTGATLAVFTVGASGVVQAANEQSVGIAFAPPASALTVSKTAGLDPAGESITVTGTNYSTSATSPYGPGGKAGVYAQIGYLDASWRPSAGAASATRSNAYSVWVQGVNDASPYLKWSDNDDGTATFTWTITITKATLDAKARAGATLAVFTVGAGGAVQADNEHAVPIGFGGVATSLTLSSPQGTTAAAGSDVTLAATVTPAVPGAVTFATAPGAAAPGAAAPGGLATVPVDGTGHAEYVVNAIAAGAVTFTARFAPTDAATYQGSSAELAFTAVAPAVTPSAPAVASGSLTWGVKQDFRAYITGPIAAGSITTSGAGTSGGAFVFPQSAATTFSDQSGTGAIPYSGSVRFYGHGGALDLTLSNPTVTITAPNAATLTVTSGGSRVAIATLDLVAATRSTNDGAISFASAPAALSSQGAPLFGGQYAAGSALDPVSFVIGSTATAQPAGTKTAAVFVAPTIPAVGSVPDATATVGCPVQDATLTWGFKESFRSYISGTIANGSWTEADGATYATPNFGWSNGTGGYDVSTSAGRVAFTGSVNFTGHAGALNTTIANPQLEFVDASTAYLLLDVTGTTQDGSAISQKAVRFAKLTLPAVTEGATKVALTELPAVLTDAGAATFGTYPAGEQLDPVSVEFSTDPACAKPADAAISARGDVKEKPTASVTGTDLTWLIWALAALLLAALVVAAILVARRRATT